MRFLRLILESLVFAMQSLALNKLRAFLSLLGISIGIFAIISVFTIVDALEANVRESVSSMGNNVIYVDKWPWAFGSDYPWWQYLKRPVPSIADMEIIHKKAAEADAVAFVISGRRTVKFGSLSLDDVEIKCVSHEFSKIRAMEFSSGRYFSESESKSGRPIAIIGFSVKEALFANRSALENSITVAGHRLNIIGTLAKEGESIIMGSADNMVLMPIQYARNFLDLRSEELDPNILVKARENVSNEELKAGLRGILRASHHIRPNDEDDFALNESSLLSIQLDSIFSVIQLAGWIIGGFSILVGGFGIANIMFVSVRERTSLIGIQKALGAKNHFILFQFLFEALFLSILGGLIGLSVIYLVTLAAGSWFDFRLVLTGNNVARGLMISAVIGMVSGLFPAYRAASLDPVEAMRSNG